MGIKIKKKKNINFGVVVQADYDKYRFLIVKQYNDRTHLFFVCLKLAHELIEKSKFSRIKLI